MILRFRTDGGDLLTLDGVVPDTTVRALKQQITLASQGQYPAMSQRLVFCGSVLADGATLAEVGVKAENVRYARERGEAAAARADADRLAAELQLALERLPLAFEGIFAGGEGADRRGASGKDQGALRAAHHQQANAARRGARPCSLAEGAGEGGHDGERALRVHGGWRRL